ncbi:hypothetical protein ACFQLX_13120 [Streptomyces polyrhachis]|uniref:Mce-associated membrane protein n=1 Tax=Streptomyces polyrhachis TaxID=1282885 RepID=A0ABW2GE99_9ACTN
MSTTRHLVNRRRRLAAAERDNPDRTTPAALLVKERPGAPVRKKPSPGRGRRGTTGGGDAPAAADGPRARRRVPWIPVLVALTLAFGAFGGFASSRAEALRDSPSRSNTALSDTVRTSEVTGMVKKAVADVFSYDFTAPQRQEAAAKEQLRGAAVEQHKKLVAGVVQQGAQLKTKLTTTVTDIGVVLIEGDRARVLVYADMINISTAKGGGTAASAAMFAVDAAYEGGGWRITSIDTFGR